MMTVPRPYLPSLSGAANALSDIGRDYRQTQQRNRLAELLPKAYGGDPTALAEVARVGGPDMYGQVQSDLYQRSRYDKADQAAAAKERQALARQGLTDAAGMIVNLPEAELPNAWGSIRGKLVSQFPELAPHLPEQYGPEVLATARGIAGIKPPQPKELGPMNVSPGGAVVDPVSGNVIYQAPYKPEEGQKPPAGYRWGANGSLAFIPGGPADPAVRAQNQGGITIDPETGAVTVGGPFKTKPIPAELGSRMALGEAWAKQVPDILGAISEGQTSGAAGRAGVAGNFGKGGAVVRRQASGVDALIRNLTGAGMTLQEAKSYADRYQIQATDSVETQRNKVLQLAAELQNIDSNIRTQYGQQPSAAYGGIPKPPNLSDELSRQPAGGFKYLGKE